MTAISAAEAKDIKKTGFNYSKFDNIEDSDDDKPAQTSSSTAKPAAPVEKPHCANCMKDISKPLRCGVCKKVGYCSATCQREDWQFHKRACKKPEEPKADAKKGAKSNGAEKSAPSRPASKSDKVVDDDDSVGTWYKHREWKPSNEPKKDFTPAKITEETKAGGEAVDQPGPLQDGSVWNKAGTWEDKDVTSLAHSGLKAKLETLASVDAGGGAIAVTEVCDVAGDASKPVIRGKRRHLFDLSFKVKFAFRWMGTQGQSKAEGTIEVRDFTNDTLFEGGEDAPCITVSFRDASSLDSGRREAVEAALGAGKGAWPPAAGSFCGGVVSKMKAWLTEFNEVS